MSTQRKRALHLAACRSQPGHWLRLPYLSMVAALRVQNLAPPQLPLSPGWTALVVQYLPPVGGPQARYSLYVTEEQRHPGTGSFPRIQLAASLLTVVPPPLFACEQLLWANR